MCRPTHMIQTAPPLKSICLSCAAAIFRCAGCSVQFLYGHLKRAHVYVFAEAQLLNYCGTSLYMHGGATVRGSRPFRSDQSTAPTGPGAQRALVLTAGTAANHFQLLPRHRLWQQDGEFCPTFHLGSARFPPDLTCYRLSISPPTTIPAAARTVSLVFSEFFPGFCRNLVVVSSGSAQGLLLSQTFRPHRRRDEEAAAAITL